MSETFANGISKKQFRTSEGYENFFLKLLEKFLKKVSVPKNKPYNIFQGPLRKE